MFRTGILLTLIVAMSIGIGYGAAQYNSYRDARSYGAQAFMVRPAAALPEENTRQANTHLNYPAEQSLGDIAAIQSEIIRLRVLFLRLAELAELSDGEFDLDLDFLPDVIDPVQEPAESVDQAFQSTAKPPLMLANQMLTHISDQSMKMKTIFEHRRQQESTRISGSPVEQGRISSRYGYRLNPGTKIPRMHRGLDYSGKPGTHILALADGIVTYSGPNGAYGNLIELEHVDGFRTRYAHNDTLLVPLGQVVRKGEQIATMGSTGRSTGTHVHVEVRQGKKALDPELYIR